MGRAGPGRRVLAKHGFVSRLLVFSRGRADGKTRKIEDKLPKNEATDAGRQK